MISKKQIRGQTIAIIILAILLICAIIFGGVFAYYTIRTNKITGKILMANLKINMTSSTDSNTGRSELVISYGTNVIPNQLLGNSPLTISNYSSVPVYLIVAYSLTAEKENNTSVEDTYIRPVIDFGFDYLNPNHPEQSSTGSKLKNTEWIDYVFTTSASGSEKTYRVLVCMTERPAADEEADMVTVIAENTMRLSEYMGNEYQATSISMVFQAYAIASESFNFTTAQLTNRAYKCQKIVEETYKYSNYTFINY